MSDDTLETPPAPQIERSPQRDSNPPKESKESRKGLFGNLNSDLKQALDTWEDLTETMAHKVSPEQEQLHEVKKLLVELKDKIKQFSE